MSGPDPEVVDGARTFATTGEAYDAFMGVATPGHWQSASPPSRRSRPVSGYWTWAVGPVP